MKSKSLVNILLLPLLLLIYSCAPLSHEQMMKDSQDYVLPQQPKENVGLVYVVRPSFLGTAVRFNLFVNDPETPEMEAGYTRGGQYIYFYIAPGTYTLLSVAENTAKGTLTVEPNKIYYIEQIPGMGFLFARNQLKLLDEVEGKYRLKKCDHGIGEIKRTLFP
jgi:hypothetical protein